MGCLDFAPWGGKVMCSLAGVLMGTAVGVARCVITNKFDS